VKLKILGSIFPQKLNIHVSNSRTTFGKNEILLKVVLNSVFEVIKQWADPKILNQPGQGWKTGLEPATS
ncbi:MAG: hypothetical protein AAGA66_03560, partial [Bacteroidota bacterium]